MLLYQISAGDPVTARVMGGLRKNAPIIDVLHFFRQPGSGAHERYGDDIDGTFDTRGIGNDFDTQTVAPGYGDFALKIIGKNIRLDTAYEERGGDVPSEFLLKLDNWSENGGRDLMSQFINGDSDADDGATPPVNLGQFDGLRKHIATLVTAGDSTRVISLGSAGLQVALGNDTTARLAQQKFVEGLENLIESIDGGADCLMMDGRLLTRLSTVARDQCVISLNEFGARIASYNGVKIIPTGRKYDGSRIIPFNETVGASTDCGSVFAFKSAEKAHLTAMTTNVGLKVYPMQKIGNFYQHTVQLQLDVKPLSKRCVAKLAGVRI
jgi:hypothetical protein